MALAGNTLDVPPRRNSGCSSLHTNIGRKLNTSSLKPKGRDLFSRLVFPQCDISLSYRTELPEEYEEDDEWQHDVEEQVDLDGLDVGGGGQGAGHPGVQGEGHCTRELAAG